MAWKGDHSPNHVHVFDGRRLLMKWDLENNCLMWGILNLKALALIRRLQKEGLLWRA